MALGRTNINLPEIPVRNYLYRFGEEFVDKTGGWEAVALSNIASGSSNVSKPTLVKNADSMAVTGVSNKRGTVRPKNNLIDFYPYKTLNVRLKTASSSSGECAVIISTTNTHGFGDNRVALLSLSNKTLGTYSVDISSVNDELYLLLYTYSNASVNIEKIWLE